MPNQPLNPQRLNRVKFSLQKLCILSHIMILEHQQDLVDTDFKVPLMNNFARRVGSDCRDLQKMIKNGGRMKVINPDEDFALDYSAELWKVFDLLCGLDIEVIKEFTENLAKEIAL